MSEHDNGGPAFPRDTGYTANDGMPLRDYFAAKAMAALIVEGAGHNSNPAQIDPMVATAYQWADAMLKERAK
jgi:hypothetical protein